MISNKSIRKVKSFCWTKNGWMPIIKTDKDSIRRHLCYYSEDYSEDLSIFKQTELTGIFEARNEIKTGRHQDTLDQLPISSQFILRDPYNWFISKNQKLFKVVDPETQGKENWGYDLEESFKESSLYRGISKTTTEILESSGLLGPEDEYTRDFYDSDIPEDFLPFAPNRANIDLNLLVNVNGNLVLDEGEVNFLSEENLYSNITFQETTKIPIFCDETHHKLGLIIENYKLLIKRYPEQSDNLRILAGQKIDKLIQGELFYSLNSSYCGRGYIPPNPKYEYICLPQEVDISFSLFKEIRVNRFHRYIKKIKSCTSVKELYGSEVQLSNGEITRRGGIVGFLSEKYHKDKELLVLWSEKDIIDKDGNLIQESAFTKAKNTYIKHAREKGYDEERIRRNVFVRFDRKAGFRKAIYEGGDLVRSGKRWQDSFWRQKKSKALTDLFMTRNQWKGIYEAIKIARKKMPSIEESQNFTQKINSSFSKIRTLEDIKSFNNWLYSVNTSSKMLKVSKAPVDYLVNSKVKILKGKLVYLTKYIQDRNKKLSNIRKQLINTSGIETELPEVSILCQIEGCNNYIHGKPKFAVIEEDKGFLFILCDCRQKIILIPWTEQNIRSKSLQEWVFSFNSKIY